MKAIILAGANDNLKHLSFTKPKPLINFLGKTTIGHIVDYLQSHLIFDISIVADNVSNNMSEYLKYMKYTNKFFSIEKQSFIEKELVKNVGYLDETFIVISEDIITDINLDELIRFHKKSGGLATIALSPVRDTQNFDIVEIEGEGRITGFYKKHEGNCYSDLANTKIYVIEPEAMDYIPLGKFSFTLDIFSIIIENGDLFGYPTYDFWKEIRNAEDYIAALSWMLEHVKKKIPSGIDSETFKNSVISDQAKIGGSIIMGQTVIGDDIVIEDKCFLDQYTCIGDGAYIEEDFNKKNSVLFEDVLIGKKSKISGDIKINDANVGGYCKLNRYVEINNGSIAWPLINISQCSIVDKEMKKFIKSSSSIDFFRTLKESEAFYFNMNQGRYTISTGYIAKSIEEFIDILKKVDQRSIDYHLRENSNDFAHWIRNVFNDKKLANELEKINKNDENVRKKLIMAISSYFVLKKRSSEVVKGESCTA